MKRCRILLFEVVFPLLLTTVLALLLKPLYLHDGKVDWVVVWVLIGLPYGFHWSYVWLASKKTSLSSTIGVFSFCIILGGLFGGLVLLRKTILGIFLIVASRVP